VRRYTEVVRVEAADATIDLPEGTWTVKPDGSRYPVNE
jgi:hypothetical protein